MHINTHQIVGWNCAFLSDTPSILDGENTGRRQRGGQRFQELPTAGEQNLEFKSFQVREYF